MLQFPTTVTSSMTTTTGTAYVATYTSTTSGVFHALGGRTWGIGSIAVFGCMAGVLVLVFGIWSLVLVLRLRKALNQASEQALHTWAAMPVGQNR